MGRKGWCMKRICLIFLFFALLVSPLYAFEVGDFNINNDVSFYYNHVGSPYRLTWVGLWKYKHIFFFKPIYRADYTRNLNDTTFQIFTPDWGLYLYKNLAFRYQYERKRIHGGRIIDSTEQRLGLSMDFKGTFFKKKLIWTTDFQFFPYQTETDLMRIRAVIKLKYGRFSLNTINYMETEGRNFYQDITTFAYSLYKNK